MLLVLKRLLSSYFLRNGRVCVWRTPREAYDPDCIISTVKHEGGSVMIKAEIYWFSFALLIALNGRQVSRHSQ